MDAGETVTGFPVVTCVPPQLPVYQYTVPSAPLAVSCVLNPLHMGFTVAVTEVGSGGTDGAEMAEITTVPLPDLAPAVLTGLAPVL